MRVTVKDYLNVRVGEPSLKAPSYQYLAPGSIIEIDGKLYEGDKYAGIATWIKDNSGNYYWSEGTNYREIQSTLISVTKFNRVKFNYNELIHLDVKYRETKGNGITIALIDTGCSNHVALNNAISFQDSHNVINNSTNINDNSTDSHGTFLAGIIASRENHDNEVIGIAPDVNLQIIKAVEDDQVDGENVLAALKYLNSLQTFPQIINLSLDFDPGTRQQDIKDQINKLITQGVIFVAAGQNETQIYSKQIFYPAREDNVMGVGSISEASIVSKQINSEIEFIIPNLNFYSLRNYGNLYKNLSGCSIASAIISGCLALILSFQKASDAKALLANEAVKLLVSSFDNSLKIYKK